MSVAAAAVIAAAAAVAAAVAYDKNDHKKDDPGTAVIAKCVTHK